MNRRKIFIQTFNQVIPKATAIGNSQEIIRFQIPDSAKSFEIKKVIWSYKLAEYSLFAVPHPFIPKAQQSDQEVFLRLLNGTPDTPFGHSFDAVTFTGVGGSSRRCQFDDTGQFEINGFVTNNRVYGQIICTNSDILNDVHLEASLLIEIETL